MSGITADRNLFRQSQFECLDLYQQQLHSIYQVKVPHVVSEFVTTDREISSALTNGDKDHLKEKLLVYQNGENLDLSLYLHSDVVNDLTRLPVDMQLEPENIGNLCHAIEGISHFLYLIWRAIRQHEVSLFELELQAEVDKYIVLLSLVRKLEKSDMVYRLHQILFEEIEFDKTLDESEKIRYQEANYYAAKYCYLFENRYMQEFGSDQMFNELRGFYRLGQNAKLRRIVNNPL